MARQKGRGKSKSPRIVRIGPKKETPRMGLLRGEIGDKRAQIENLKTDIADERQSRKKGHPKTVVDLSISLHTAKRDLSFIRISYFLNVLKNAKRLGLQQKSGVLRKAIARERKLVEREEAQIADLERRAEIE